MNIKYECCCGKTLNIPESKSSEILFEDCYCIYCFEPIDKIKLVDGYKEE